MDFLEVLLPLEDILRFETYMSFSKTKKIIKPIVVAVVVSLMAGVLAPASFCVQASNIDDLKKSISEKKAQISEANSQKNELQTGLSDVKRMVNELQGLKNDLETYVTKLDSQLEAIEKKIEELRGLIKDKETEIEETTLQLEEAEKTAATQYAAMKKRVKFMYERGQTFYLELFFSSNGFSDMLNKVDYISKLTEYDRNKLAEFQALVEQIEVLKESLEAEKEVLDEAKLSVEKEQETLTTLMAEKQKEINAYEADIGDKEAQIAAYEQEIADRNATISALEAAVAAEQRELDEANRRRFDGGKFAWPAPSYTRISDDYGNRMHPTLGIEKFHNGIDMASPNGSPVLAAYDGDVVAADYNASMGNYIMIDHGSKIYTIYMHCSSLGVSKGQTVSRGQKIGAVGSTGRSTGPHLHFSVRVNGEYVSPWGYFGS